MYADFNFYKNSFYGDMIADENEYQKWGLRASASLDLVTSGSLKGNLPSDADNLAKIRQAECAAAEELKEISLIQERIRAKEVSGEGGGTVKSLSSGGESITYDTSALAAAVNGGQQAINRYLRDTVKTYLSGVCDDAGRYYLYEGLE